MVLRSPAVPVSAVSGPGMWVGSWSSAQVRAASSGRSQSGFRNQTIRSVVRLSVGGSAVRIRLSNAFGARPLPVHAAHVALRLAGAATVPGTGRAVTFGGQRHVVVPPGERVFSDPVPLALADGADLTVSLYLGDAAGPATWHPNAMATSYRTEYGDHTADIGPAAFTGTGTSWYFLDGVDVVNPAAAGAVVAFGPSTTDGIGSARDANNRYPDQLARRLLALPDGQRLSVLNAGIAGNKLLADGGTCGPSALDRFVRDAIDQSGVRAVIVWEGTNDVATRPGLRLGEVTGAYQRLIAIARSRGVAVIGATLQPHEGAGFYSDEGNRLRGSVNDWIRWSGAFDDVADYDQVLQDPHHPSRMRPDYDSGDHLHPNDAGYAAIAASLDLAALAGAEQFAGAGVGEGEQVA